jgi:hypothetical protein
MPLIPKQPEADREVIAYWLAKLRWTAAEFSALYCGVNPYALKEDDEWEIRRALGGANDGDENYQIKVSREKLLAIKEILVLINDRLEPYDQISGSPREWRSKLIVLRLAELPWMQQIQEPKKEELMKPKIPPEKPLDTRAENTLLVIIKALCERLAIKTNERGAATQIAKFTQEIGAPVNDDTVRRWLKEIPQALERREK